MPDQATNERPIALGAILKELRAHIGASVRSHPERIIFSIPFDKLSSLTPLSEGSLIAMMGHLERYTGAALYEGDDLIPWQYKFYPLLVSRRIEVLLKSDDLKVHPIARLATEVAAIARDQAEDIDIDSVFAFFLPACAIERVEEMNKRHRSSFRTSLQRQLEGVGLSLNGGSILSQLEIRRNR